MRELGSQRKSGRSLGEALIGEVSVWWLYLGSASVVLYFEHLEDTVGWVVVGDLEVVRRLGDILHDVLVAPCVATFDVAVGSADAILSHGHAGICEPASFVCECGGVCVASDCDFACK